ncbi:uncharacterized protein ASPGLDRAFT_36368 [Aspergillus glaucus CBS 516.65]|uniref:Uncharacterized protein n=1 Tax=Aspergillus glaucus CBS 516.65 TaxID=1160497 RepID=A0A1L9VI94_ASPGL|nr:hypothetical protein ASPGLDRAFT_36368 [Aspergillus glaucus CBS 516.65]OJJ83646.1 hypothetical protein ASPGLDRAFT_36368 [Aspergillus glaucus CBS 516.65]
MRDITYYKTDEIPPIDSITWDQLITYLKAGYDPRFCGTLDAAKDNINNGTMGDALAVFESFSHFIFKLNKESKIRVEDNYPFKHEIRKEIHKHLYATLDSYQAALGDSTKMKTAWDAVLSVLSPANGFYDTAKTTICKEFYDSLTKYVIQCGTLNKQTALVLVKACPKVNYYDEGMYGRFAK